MSGASEQTQRVVFINANLDLSAGEAFELLVVTEDDVRHVLPLDVATFTALAPLLRDDVTFLFDPIQRTLIVANLVGQWIQKDWTAGSARQFTPPRTA